MLTIDLVSCTGCGICQETCIYQGIEVADGAAVLRDTCTLCGSCVEECPLGALAILDSNDRPDASSGRDVWVWLETRDNDIKRVSLELLSVGRELADARGERLVAVIIHKDGNTLADKAWTFGADRIWIAAGQGINRYDTGVFADIICEMAVQEQPAILLMGATSDGRDLAPRVAARLRTGLTADCTGLAIDAETGNLLQTRPAFGGNIMATIVTPQHSPQMATVRPGAMKLAPGKEKEAGEILNWSVSANLEYMTTLLEHIATDNENLDLETAPVIVAGGRGVGGPDGLKLMQDLAEALGGVMAVSRAPVEEGWISPEYQIGQTGKTVAPALYIACGISGTIQHLVGMKDSGLVVAINKDSQAPIFKTADLGLVGDIFSIVPELIKMINKRKDTSN
ncbi:MAG: FAD-binding protein [Chitinophagales bacterium]